ncbi:hypothetical protein JXA12_05130 [Candidatus Woesearchaeota archaeon]|nr:hypothetical protein [Candidatus Woesearchaeota archaeon]
MATRRAQAALEFLTTYGWMIFMVLAAGGALAYFGVFDFEKSLPDQCAFGFDFSCSRHVLLSDGTVRVELANKVGEPVEMVSFICTYQHGVSSSMDVSSLGTWDVGEDITLTCPGTTMLPPNERAEVSVLLQYRKVSGGFIKGVQGSVTGTVVEA